MKKIFTILSAIVLFAATGFAQASRSAMQPALKASNQAQAKATKIANASKNAAKISGNPVWQETMSYCGNEPFYTSVGNSSTQVIYWGIKLESAALVGRNNIVSVQFYVADEDNAVGTYTMSIHQDSPTGTTLLTQNVTTTLADTLAWKTITLTSPLAITQGHDLYVCFYTSGLDYPATAIAANNYDNGKWASIDGTSWDLVSNLGVDVTWMIRVVSDTYTEQAPMISLDGPTGIVNGEEATFTATSQNTNSYSWAVDGTTVSGATGNTLSYTFTTDGNHTVAVTGTNNAGSTTESLTVEVYTCGAITNFPYTLDFESGIRCWSTISMDPANDEEFGINNVADYAYEGNASFMFSSYDAATDYNQWLISPELALPYSSIQTFSFMYMGFTDADAFRIMASSTDNNPSSFTQLADFSTVATEWTQVAVALPEGTKYVAIDYYAEYEYYLFVDNITIGSLPAPTVTINGPATAIAGTEVTFTATSPLAESFSWAVDGTAVSGTNATLAYTFATAGNHTVTVTATNASGSNSATANINIISCDPITQFPWGEDFETADVYDCWQFIDADGDGYNWNTDYLRNFEGDPQGHNNSNGMVGSASYANTALTPDNWMILPAMALPAGSSLYLSWYAKGQDAEWADEHYSVYISTTGSSVSNFTTLLFSETTTGEWAGHSVSLAQYAGQTVYIAFRHHNVTDMFYLDIDDIWISDEALGIHEAAKATVSLYPNPTTGMLRIEGEDIVSVEILDLNGRSIMTAGANTSAIDLSTLSNGIYMVRTVTANGVSNQKVVKK